MTAHDTPARIRIAFIVAALGGLLQSGCSDHMSLESKLDGDLKTSMQLDGDLMTTMKLEGPINMQVQMQGPTIRYEGTYISDELFDHVKLNKATGEWLIAVLGQPNAMSELTDGTEIWRWTYRPVEQQTSLVQVFSSREEEPKLATRSVFVTLKDGVVVEKWKG